MNMLRQIAGRQGYETYACIVKSVSGATCNVQRIIDDKPMEDVRLNATVKLGDGVVITPVVGSVVLITNIDGGKYFVSQFSGIERVVFSDVSGFECVIENGTISVKNKGYSLRRAFDDIISAIGKLTVTTGVGPSGTPINIAEFQSVGQKLNNFLK